MTRILLVEDDDTVAEVVDSYLRASDMIVVRCGDGLSAVGAAQFVEFLGVLVLGVAAQDGG